MSMRVLVRVEIESRKFVERVIEVEDFRDAWARRESALTPYIPAGYSVVRYDSEGVDDEYPSRGAVVIDERGKWPEDESKAKER